MTKKQRRLRESKAKVGHTFTAETKSKMSNIAKGRFKGYKWKVVNNKRVWYKEDEYVASNMA